MLGFAGEAERGTIEGPTEGGFSTIFGNSEVIFAENVGRVWGGGEAFLNTVEGMKL